MNPPSSSSKAMIWTGRVLSWLPAAFLLFNSVLTLTKPPFVVEGTVKMGYPESAIVGMGLALMISILLYLIPRTSILGAILITGYLGGAVATHVRVKDGWFETLFPVIFATLFWGGLYLRDARLRALIPFRTNP